ncbi:MAG: leucine-rich repeat protein [Oscillospiraceae bacterium]|nr:leucine-rich repeat protein [Oscillospiraceae bacterium]
MKKTVIIRVLAIVLVGLMVLSVGAGVIMSVNAQDDPNFTISDGVLTKYNGTDQNVTIPSAVFYIGDFAFENNTTLNTVTFAGEVNYIGQGAFSGCTALTAIYNTQKVTSVGADAFKSTPFLSSMPGDFKTLNKILLQYSGTQQTVTVADGVNSIAPGAFAGNRTVQTITLPATVAEIGEKAFYGCVSLENINLPATVTTIGRFAFEGTSWLSEQSGFVIAGNGILVKYIGDNTNISTPNEVLQIAPSAFEGSNIQTVRLSGKIYLLGSYAFYNCQNLKSVKFNMAPSVFVDEFAFANCSNLSILAFYKDSLTSMDSTAINNSPKTEIFADSGTLAAEFANTNGITLNPAAGDVDSMAGTTIGDATEIQKFLAKLIKEEDFNTKCGDFNCDGKVDIIDVTALQKMLAKIDF